MCMDVQMYPEEKILMNPGRMEGWMDRMKRESGGWMNWRKKDEEKKTKYDEKWKYEDQY